MRLTRSKDRYTTGPQPARRAAIVLVLLVGLFVTRPADAQTPAGPVRLLGHTLAALSRATRVSPQVQANALGQQAAPAEAPITLAITLKRSDEAGFQRYLSSVQNKGSPSFQHFSSAADLTRRFGPSQAAYDAVLGFLTKSGLTLVQGSADRLTITMAGSRAQIAQAFAVNINDYTLNGKSFRANDQDPAVPATIAPYVQGIAGLSNLAGPMRAPSCVGHGPVCAAVGEELDTGSLLAGFLVLATLGAIVGIGLTLRAAACPYAWESYKAAKLQWNYDKKGTQPQPPKDCGSKPAGTPDPTVGLLEFDSFNTADVANWLNLSGLPASQITQLSVKSVNGGVAAPGPNEPEVLLDIDTLMLIASDPSVNYVVYEAPFASSAAASFISQFSTMTNDHVDVISNSWTACEDQMSQADAQAIDNAIAQAAAAGITVVNAAGDNAGACSDGTPNTVAVPADSPNGTAVGATTVTLGPGSTYGSEALWSRSSFGQSAFFATPSYQQSVTPKPAMRSVPDVVMPADPTQGMLICEADNGGCPNGYFYGGTSLAAPEFAAFAVLLNEVLGHNVGNLNPVLYGAGIGAYHPASSMATDFQHAGLGGPIPDRVLLAMDNHVLGAPDAAISNMVATPPVVDADGKTKAYVVVYAHDSGGHFLSGQNATLSCTCGTSVITPVNPVTDQTLGAAVFSVTDTTPETIAYSASIQGVTLTHGASVTFRTPGAANGTIVANPSTVNLNGSSTVTVTLKNGLTPPGPAAAKQINLMQNGHANVQVAGNGITDVNGQVQFSAFDSLNETVTFTAYDVTDGLTVGSAPVTFTQNPPPPCITGTPTAQNGYAFTGFATGFPYDPSFCIGPLGLAFDSAGNLNVINNGGNRFYRFGPGGGIASGATVLPNTPGPASGMTYGKDGELYVTQTQYPGSIWQVDPLTGAFLREVYDFSSNNFIYFCPLGIATDPISGDLFVSQEGCFATQPAAIVRIQNPASATPTAVAYASPGLSDGLAFGPDGTLYAASATGDVNNDDVVAISRTGVVTPVANVPGADGIAVGPNPTNLAGPPFLFVTSESNGTITKLDLSAYPATQTVVFSGGSRGDFAAVGRDGCFYATQTDQIVRLTNADGTCSLVPTSGAPQLSLSPIVVIPQPATGAQQTFTATFSSVSVPPGTPVTFTVNGANSQTHGQANTDANGKATFTYTGTHAGADTVVASANLAGTPLTSNQATLTWIAGKDVTFINLNGSATSGARGQSVPLQATLTDVTQNPAVPIANATVTITLQSGSCSPTTNVNGVATCNQTVSGPINSYTLSASYAGSTSGTPQYTASTASTAFLATQAGKVGVTTNLTAGSQSGTTLTVPAGTAVTDTATLSGATGTAGGTLTFTVYSDNACTAVVAGFASTVTVTNGVVPASTAVTFPTQGTFYWQAQYAGDTDNLPATSTCGGEVVTVTTAKATVSIGTTPSSPSVSTGVSMHDSATLTGATGDAGGSVTYELFAGATCNGTPVATSTVTVASHLVPDSAVYTPTNAGTYNWLATYSGDAKNLAASGTCGAETVTVTGTVTDAPDMTITKTHTGDFSQGQRGATYTITVTNSGGKPTNGKVTVSDTLPAGLTATSMSGTGWNCIQPGGPCSRSDALGGNSSYDVITLTVNVAGNTASSVTNTVTVSGGGETETSNDTATDPTTVTLPPQCAGMTFDKVVVMTSPIYNSFAANRQLVFAPQSGNATVTLHLAHDSCIVAGEGSLTAIVNYGKNVLVGGPARDSLIGGSGDDTLIGGGAPSGGKDSLIGGGGTDTCVGTAAETVKTSCEK